MDNITQPSERIISLVKDGIDINHDNYKPISLKEQVRDAMLARFIPAGPTTCVYNFYDELLVCKEIFHRIFDGNASRDYTQMIAKSLRRIGARYNRMHGSFWVIDLYHPENRNIVKDNIDFINYYKQSNFQIPKRKPFIQTV